MADEHFSPETIQRFFRSELPRDQVRVFVRHLLRQCPQCQLLLQQVAQRQEFRFLIRALEEGASRPDPQPRVAPEASRSFPCLAEPEEVPAGQGGSPPERRRAWLR